MFRSALLFAALASAFTLPVGADWLVTNEGARIETKGKWNIKGGTIVFTAPSGTLSSIRLTEVDLDASAAATMEAKNPSPPPEEEKKRELPEPVLVLTNADIGPGNIGASLPAAGEGEGAATPAPQAPGPDGTMIDTVSGNLKVVRSGVEDSPVGKAVVVSGIVRNDGEIDVNNVQVNVNFVDPEGKVITYVAAEVRGSMLRAGKATTFRAILRDVERADGEPSFNLTGEPVGKSDS